jgi:acetylornithine deacetylase/succinyl-diaminopimelate desuccinylase-like protein
MSHERVAKIVTDAGNYNAARTSMDLAISREVIRTVESARGPAVKVPTLGGSAPLDAVERAVNIHTIVIPIANHDDNQHTFDENLRIQNLWDGIELMAALLAM